MKCFENGIEFIDEVFKLIKLNSFKDYSKIFVANLFFEPSTRTHYSFQIAQKNMNMKVLSFLPEVSSMKKGENFYQTAKIFESFDIDLMIVRHSENEYYKKFDLKIPIINAGAGSNSHPTQTILDLYTIKEEFNKFENLTVGIVGDLKYSRVATANTIRIMKRLGMKVLISGPPELVDTNDNSYRDFKEILSICDVLMLLRVQHERHFSLFNINNYNEKYGLNSKNILELGQNAIVMHPGPFNIGMEITEEVLKDKRIRIFRQVKNGIKIRKAVMQLVLEKQLSLLTL